MLFRSIFIFQVLEPLQLAYAHAPKLAFPTVKGGFTNAVFPANLDHSLALVLLTQNPQNLGFAKTNLFHEQLKIEKVNSYYFSLFLTGLLTGGAYSSGTRCTGIWAGLFYCHCGELPRCRTWRKNVAYKSFTPIRGPPLYRPPPTIYINREKKCLSSIKYCRPNMMQLKLLNVYHFPCVTGLWLNSCSH